MFIGLRIKRSLLNFQKDIIECIDDIDCLADVLVFIVACILDVLITGVTWTAKIGGYLLISKFFPPFYIAPIIWIWLIKPFIMKCKSYTDKTIPKMNRKTFNTLYDVFKDNFYYNGKEVIKGLAEYRYINSLMIYYKSNQINVPFIVYLKFYRQAVKDMIIKDINDIKSTRERIGKNRNKSREEYNERTTQLIKSISHDIDELRGAWKDGK